jgi:hypothetical protein
MLHQVSPLISPYLSLFVSSGLIFESPFEYHFFYIFYGISVSLHAIVYNWWLKNQIINLLYTDCVWRKTSISQERKMIGTWCLYIWIVVYPPSVTQTRKELSSRKESRMFWLCFRLVSRKKVFREFLFWYRYVSQRVYFLNLKKPQVCSFFC